MPNLLRNPFVLGAAAILMAAAAAVVVVIVFSEGEETTVVVIPTEETPEETPAPSTTATRTPVPLDGMRALALSTLTVRTGPGSRYVSLGIVRRGAELDVVGKNGDESWLEISYPPRSRLRGWVTTESVELEGSMATLPVATPESLVLPVVPTYPPATVVDQQPDATPTPEVPPGPDLLLSDAYLVEGELMVTVTNQGTADAGAPIDVAIYSGDGSGLLRLLRSREPLPAGASVDIPTQYDPAGGPQRLLIRVDPSNRVEETDEDNNEVLFGVSALPATPSPSPTATSPPPTVTATPRWNWPQLFTPTAATASATPTSSPTPTPIATGESASAGEP